MTYPKRVSIQLKLYSKPYGRSSSCLLRTLSRLAILMNYKLRKLTSRKIETHWAAEQLNLYFMMRAPRRNGLLYKPICKTKVPIITDQREHGLIRYWHEPSRKAVELKVLEAYNSIDQKLIKGSQLVELKASGFAKVHIPEWKCFEPTERSQLRKLEELKRPLNPYLPMTEYQLKIIKGENTIVDHPKQVPAAKSTLRQAKIEEFFLPRRELLTNKDNVEN